MTAPTNNVPDLVSIMGLSPDDLAARKRATTELYGYISATNEFVSELQDMAGQMLEVLNSDYDDMIPAEYSGVIQGYLMLIIRELQNAAPQTTPPTEAA